MNRFFRSALFPLVIIAALVWLAITTLSHSSGNNVTTTTSGFIQDIKTGQIDTSKNPVTIDPNKQSFTATLKSGDTVTVHYATDQSEYSIERAMRENQVTFNSKGVGSSPWWSILRACCRSCSCSASGSSS